MVDDYGGARPTSLWAAGDKTASFESPDTVTESDAAVEPCAASASCSAEAGQGDRLSFAVEDCASDEFEGAAALTFDIAGRGGRGGMSGAYTAVLHSADGATPGSIAGRLEGATVLLKIASSERAARNEWRHLKEFRSLSALPEPYFLLIGEDGGGIERYAIVMELLKGETLAVWAQNWTADLGYPPPVEYVIDALAPVFDFIKVASTARPPLVHRDIKPSNIIVQMLPGKGLSCRLIDLGISYRADASGDGTLPGTLSSPGTWGFAPPEVIERRASGAGGAEAFNDPRIDTFGLAATLYSVLSGKAYAYHWDGGFSLAHWWDRDHRCDLYASVRAYLLEHDAVIPDIRVATDAIQDAVDEVDARIMSAIAAGLSDAASKRPLPGDFIEMLKRCSIRGEIAERLPAAYQRALENHLAKDKAVLPEYTKPFPDFDEVMELDGECITPVRGFKKHWMGRAVNFWCEASKAELKLERLSHDYVRAGVFSDDSDAARAQIDKERRGLKADQRNLRSLATDTLKNLAQFQHPPQFPLGHFLYGCCLKDWDNAATMEEVCSHWRAAADGGLAMAMYDLGVYYERCRYGGGAHDYDFYVADAKYRYGQAIERGFEEARPCYERMCAEEDAQRLTRMWLEGTPAERAAAEREALKWRRSGTKGKFVRWD